MTAGTATSPGSAISPNPYTFDWAPGLLSQFIHNPFEAHGKLYFVTDDGTHGDELWVTDGTAAGTSMLKDINPSPGLPYYGPAFGPTYSAALGDLIIFSADDGTNGEEPWVTDGTPAGTFMLKDVKPGAPGSLPWGLTVSNGKVFFEADDATNGFELWATDGTAIGTVLVKDINPGTADSHPWELTDFNGRLYFRANGGASGIEPWVSDGTSIGTTILKDVNAGAGSSDPSWFTPVGGKLLFAAGAGGVGLWSSDGTEGGTSQLEGFGGVADQLLPVSVYAWGPGRFSPFRFFVRTPGARSLWVSDGTAVGTVVTQQESIRVIP